MKNSTATAMKQFKIQICVNEAKKRCALVAHDDSIDIGMISLKRLCMMQNYIQRLKHTLEQQSKKSETAFFQLLSHFYYDKTIHEACVECESNSKVVSFFEQIINFHCHSLDKTFVLEIALNCEIWFELCIPYFIKTLMLNELQRWETFRLSSSKSKWPFENNKICARHMSKSGFYYTGTMDNTICAFCGVSLHDWKAGDVLIIQHHKSQPKCPYLVNHNETLNVDYHKNYKLDENMQQLKK